jgi:hypothetical protein
MRSRKTANITVLSHLQRVACSLPSSRLLGSHFTLLVVATMLSQQLPRKRHPGSSLIRPQLSQVLKAYSIANRTLGLTKAAASWVQCRSWRLCERPRLVPSREARLDTYTAKIVLLHHFEKTACFVNAVCVKLARSTLREDGPKHPIRTAARSEHPQ